MALSTGPRPRSFPEQKGMSILLDVFYRADTNVDGVLTTGEFRSFFCDRSTSEQNAKDIFGELAIHDSTVHASEFCAFVVQHEGAFREVLAALEDLSTSIYHAAEVTTEDYVNEPFRSKFVTRILLRETLLQLATIQGAVEGVCLRIEEHEAPQNNRHNSTSTEAVSSTAEASAENHVNASSAPSKHSEGGNRRGIISPTVSSTMMNAIDNDDDSQLILESRVLQLEEMLLKQEKLSNAVLSQADNMDVANDHLVKLCEVTDKLDEVNSKLLKVERIVGRIEEKVEFEKIQEEIIDNADENLFLVIQEKLEVEEQRLYEFRRSLEAYVDDTRLSDGCLHVSVLTYQDMPVSIIYEIWESEERWSSHVRSPIYKTFQHQNIEHLKKPEFFNTIQLPASWWKKSDR